MLFSLFSFFHKVKILLEFLFTGENVGLWYNRNGVKLIFQKSKTLDLYGWEGEWSRITDFQMSQLFTSGAPKSLLLTRYHVFIDVVV